MIDKLSNHSNVLLLDIYPDSIYRVSKDTNGGFGTVNNYGSGFVSKALSKRVAEEVDWPPLELMYVGSLIRNSGANVIYSRDKNIDLEGVDYVVMSSSIVAHESELDVLSRLTSCGINVCVIGSFVTAMPKPYQTAGGVVVIGEPEAFFLKNTISDLFNSGSKVVTENSRADVDELPPPAWDLFLKENDLKFGLLSKSVKMIPMLATRGCPYNCYEYCTYPLQQGRRIRSRNVKLIVDEMDDWIDTYDIELFIFRDPVFSLSRAHTVSLCNELISRANQYQFVIETHLKNINNELLELLVKAGLKMIKVGIESVDERVLANNNRFSLQKDEQLDLIRHIESFGVAVVAHSIIGMPGESFDSYGRTLEYAKKLNSLIAQFSVFTPYPGTPKYIEYESKIIAHKFEEFTQFDLVFKHDKLSRGDIDVMVSKAYSTYYMRPLWVFKYLKYKVMGC